MQTPPKQHIARPGFKIDEVRTEHHEFPSRTPAGPQGSGSTPPPTAQFAQLPPGHPLARYPDVNGQNTVVQSNGATIGDSQRALLDNQARAARPVFDRPQSETDPEYFSLTVPSLHKFYEFQFEHLSIRNIKGFHQAKFHKASKEANLRYLVEAMSSLLGDGVSAFDLTSQDFYFLMFWQRVSSFPKTPQIITSKCTELDHVRRTIIRPEDPEYLDPKTLDIEVFLDKTTMETDYLEDFDISPWASLNERRILGVETMRDIVEYQELEEELNIQNARNASDGELAQAEIDTDMLMWLSGRAAFLKPMEGRRTLKERIEVVKSMDGDEIMELEGYIDACTAYGVKEYAQLKCKECGAHHRVQISVDALNFLPDRR